ncbi:MAG: helix-turn-helix transcriptional regulator [bacterium]
MEIAEQVKRLRKKAGLTQHELAIRAGVGLRFVRELEQGKPTIRPDKVNLVLALFGYHQFIPFGKNIEGIVDKAIKE